MKPQEAAAGAGPPDMSTIPTLPEIDVSLHAKASASSCMHKSLAMFQHFMQQLPAGDDGAPSEIWCSKSSHDSALLASALVKAALAFAFDAACLKTQGAITSLFRLSDGGAAIHGAVLTERSVLLQYFDVPRFLN